MLTISAIHNKEISRHDTPWPYTYMTWYSIQPAQDQHLQGTMKHLEEKEEITTMLFESKTNLSISC